MPNERIGFWVDNEKALAGFWAWAKSNRFEHEEVHALLGVSSLKDYEGTLGDAKTRLMATRKQKSGPASAPAPEPAPASAETPPYVPPDGLAGEPSAQPEAQFPDLSPDLAAALTDESAVPPSEDDQEALMRERELADHYAIDCRALPEMPGVAFTRIRTPGGLTWTVTLRSGLHPDTELQSVWSLTRQMRALETFATSAGWTGVFDGRDSLEMPQPRNGVSAPSGQNVPPPARASAPTAPSAPPRSTGSTPPPQTGGQSGEPLTFAAESLHGSITDGKTYFKVKGGKFTQYGVTIWEEALTDAGFDYAALVKAVAEKLIAGQSAVFSISGYTAHYQLNDKNKPNKVTKLELTRAA